MVPGTWDFQCQNQECAPSTRLGWEMGIKELLASSTYFLCPEDRSLSSEGSLFPPLASLPSAVLMTPHLLPALLLQRAWWRRKSRDWPKGGEELISGFQIVLSLSIGVETSPFTGKFSRNVLTRCGSGLTISDDFSQVHSHQAEHDHLPLN